MFLLWRIPKRDRKWWLILAVISLLMTPVVALFIVSNFLSLPAELSDSHEGSIRVLDRSGGLLREVRAQDGSKERWVALGEAGQVPRALIATEDARFESHHGVDYWAVLRAAVSNAYHFRAVSGASTITMQLVRNVRPHPRTLRGKFMEAALALRIERSISKDAILEQYINRVEFGPNLRGVGAASQAYFDKPPRRLSLGESSLLAGLVRGPSYYDLEKNPDRGNARRRLVLARMVRANAIDEAQEKVASEEPIVLQTQRPVFGAPHFVSALLGEKFGVLPIAPAGGSIVTTLDRDLQRSVETSVVHTIAALEKKHVTAAAVIVIENETGDILAYVGSPNFFDENGGQNDGVLSLRQPGSTLKPFVYELAMERLGFTPATILPDIEWHLKTAGGEFVPHNYDQTFHGPVRLREALGNSFNVPAIWTAEQLGTSELLDRLHLLGFASLSRSAEFYGPALALGDGEVTLLELTNAYATLARGGFFRPVRATRRVLVNGQTIEAKDAPIELRLPEQTVHRLTDILKDPRARSASFGEGNVLEFSFDVASKTGTSKGYRDNWTVGYSPDVTVGVWVGNFDGSPMEEVSGITGAGPIFHQVMVAAMSGREKRTLAHDDESLERVEICALSGARATSVCKVHVFESFTHDEALSLPFCDMHVRVPIDRSNGLRAGDEGGEGCDIVQKTFEAFPPEYDAWARSAGRALAPLEFSPNCHQRANQVTSTFAPVIRSPLDQSSFFLDPDRDRAIQVLSIDVVAPPHTPDITLLVDGTVTSHAPAPYTMKWRLETGDHVLVAKAGSRESAPVTIHVRE